MHNSLNGDEAGKFNIIKAISRSECKINYTGVFRGNCVTLEMALIGPQKKGDIN